ncbi:phosphoribosylaminoimidazolecarboxamide formyltransferase [Salinispira pacifica]|uniref:Phosphoribosylaminoimidazolecarboxamide formyltransferase n=1 Tax=Salinispira pacifica TaxID=1307761 RepID=V5WJ81_9SPIO|nr:phosphoribosylaminoimidazolecarboxamide formyltransferase [Salinispira pacifica]AHC15226.1 Phosphoribosylaminoimidazolecarboxamide formyltransferase [Salinispira pacifica]
MSDLKKMYRQINSDSFPGKMEIAFEEDGERQVLYYEKTSWEIDGERKGLRYGENPDQPAALYRPVNGNLHLGEVETLEPGNYLASDAELLQSGKHPGKINITDIDAALNILRYLHSRPAAVIIKHNNPSGAAVGSDLYNAYHKAFQADRLAAFGGAVAVNRPLDKETAEYMVSSYIEVLAAPDFENGVMEILARRKNLRVMRIRNISRLESFVGKKVLDFSSLMDGGLILQYQFEPAILSPEQFLPAESEYKGESYRVTTEPTRAQLEDMLFGWLVEAGITSNSVIYVKDGATVGIGTGEQDRVGVAEIARDKAYRKYADRLSWELFNTPFNLLQDSHKEAEVMKRTRELRGNLEGSIMVSDAFFPFRDGVDVGLKEKIGGIVQPGGSLRDFESIQACNEAGIPMVFTGQRSFKH